MLALSAITGWTLFAALIVSVGAVTGRWLIVPRMEGEGRDTLLSASRALGRLGGGLFPVAMVLVFWRQTWRRRPDAHDASLLPTLVPLFSPIALVSVACLIVTGTLASWLNLTTDLTPECATLGIP